ncbi:MAG: hypothetical protein R2834_13170 [Rhodothermales bacterium]
MDFAAGNNLVALIGVIAAGLFALYFGLEILLPMMRKAQKSNRKQAEERAAELYDQFVRNEHELDRIKRDVAMRAPQIRMLRAGRADHETTCLFINDGGTAKALEVTPIGPFKATISPRDQLKNGETGRIDIRDAAASLRMLQFRITYMDSYAERVSRLYAYSEKEGRFKEI